MAYETVHSGREVLTCGGNMLPRTYMRVELEGLQVVKKGGERGDGRVPNWPTFALKKEVVCYSDTLDSQPGLP